MANIVQTRNGLYSADKKWLILYRLEMVYIVQARNG